MSERWTIVGKPYRYEGGADPGADVDFGFRIDLQSPGGGERKVNVERAQGSDHSLTATRALEAVRDYLDEEDPPGRILLTRHGRFVRSS